MNPTIQSAFIMINFTDDDGFDKLSKWVEENSELKIFKGKYGSQNIFKNYRSIQLNAKPIYEFKWNLVNFPSALITKL